MRERLDGRSDPSVEELRALAEDVWDSLPGSDAERALMRQMVNPEDWLTAVRADPETEAAWLARVEETGRLFDPDSYGMQTLFQGPDGHVYRRDPDKPPRPELLQTFMVSRGLESWAWKLRNRQGLIDMDPEVWRELLVGASSGAAGWVGGLRTGPGQDFFRQKSLEAPALSPPADSGRSQDQ